MTVVPGQLLLDLPHRQGHAQGDFLPAPCNEAALGAVLAWPNWPTAALAVTGPNGSGKTHLACIWAARTAAVVFNATDLWYAAGPLERLGAARAAVVDGADETLDEPGLFHLYNELTERQGSLLVTGEGPVATWPLRLPDLRSRLATAWQVRIEPPCDALLVALLVKQFADRQLRVEPGVVDFLISRMERSFPSVRRLVEALDRASLRARRPIRLALARAVLHSLAGADDEPAAVTGTWEQQTWISL